MKQIIVNCQFSQTRIAVLEEGKLVEFYLEQPSNERLVGNIYKGKVADIRPGIQAAFVDIGLDKNAYLYIDDCLTSSQKEAKDTNPINIRELVTEGQDLIVQVTKEPFGTKGPRITPYLSFPGRKLVYMPNDSYIGVSRKIESEEERERLRELCKGLCNETEGVIVRTQAEEASEEDISHEFLELRRQWEEVKQAGKQAKSKSLIHQEVSLLPKIARDLLNTDIAEWVIDSQQEYKQIISLIEEMHPQLVHKVKFYRERKNIFEAFGIEGEIEKALKRKVWLKSGGYIVIDQTEALTAIDVNTGKFTGSHSHQDTVLKTNLEAAGEIARQLRLRDIGGIIIIDFIDMNNEENRQAVYLKLSEKLKKDRTKSHLLGFTSLGLLEMTRKKVKQNLFEKMTTTCPSCDGRGRILSEDSVLARLEGEIREYAKSQDYEAFLVEVHPHLERELSKEKKALIQRIEKEWGIRIYLQANDKVNQDRYLLAFIGTEEDVKRRLLQPS